MLDLVGRAYERRADIWIGEQSSWGSRAWRLGVAQDWSETGHNLSTKAEAASAAYDAYKSASKMEEMGPDEDAEPETEPDASP